MNFLHARVHARAGATIDVRLSRRGVNVMIMSDPNFHRYQRGEGFEYYGDNFDRTRVNLVVPATGYWNVVVDLGGAPGTVNATYSVLPV